MSIILVREGCTGELESLNNNIMVRNTFLLVKPIFDKNNNYCQSTR